MGAFVRYNLLRFGLFVGFGALFYFVGVAGLLLVVLAALASGVTSYYLLAKQRKEMVDALAGRVAARQERSAARAAREDAYDEQLRAGEPDL